MGHSLKHRLEYWIAIFWIGMFRLAPYRIALAVGWIAAWFGHYVIRYRRRMARDRIQDVFPSLSRRQVRAIAWKSWYYFVFNMIDTLRLCKMDSIWLHRHIVDYASLSREGGMASVAGSSGMVAVSLHMGCSEMAARVLQDLGCNVFVIYKPQKNQLVDKKLYAMRSATGIACLPVSNGLYRQVLKRLRSGSVLALLADLRVYEGGVEVDFLGQRARVGAGADMFARRAGVPLGCAIALRSGWCRHRIDVKFVLTPDLSLSVEEDVQRMMQSVFTTFDAAVRQWPEQWFWYNKKWILG